MSERAWRLFLPQQTHDKNCALSSSLGMAPTVFTSVLVSVLHCTVIDLHGKSVVIPQPQTGGSAAALCPALWMAFANTSALQGKLPLPYPTCAWSLRLTALLHSAHKKKNVQAHREAWNPTVRHYKIWFNPTSPRHTMNIIWLI